MEEIESEAKNANSKEAALPHYMWNTLIFKAVLNFDLHLRKGFKHYASDHYMMALSKREKERTIDLKNSLKGVFLITGIALLYLDDFNFSIPSVSFDLLSLPIIGEIICLFLGLSIFSSVIIALDIMIISKVRSWIASILGTDVPSLLFLEFKGEGLWSDLFTPKIFGYQSSLTHKISCMLLGVFFLFFLLCLLLIPYVTMVAVLVKSINSGVFSWGIPSALQVTGVITGTFAVLVAIISTMIPFKFVADPAISAQGDLGPKRSKEMDRLDSGNTGEN